MKKIGNFLHHSKQEILRVKKGQLKIQQMAFMLMAIVLFFALVGLLILGFQSSGMKQEAMLIEEENAIGLADKIANSPEFSCGDAFGTTKINCIDSDKLMAIKKNIAKFEELWGNGITNIRVIRIYPEGDAREQVPGATKSGKQDFVGIKECDVGNYPDCNLIVLKELKEDNQGFSASSIVSLCRKESLEGEAYDKCEIARILINYKDWRENEG